GDAALRGQRRARCLFYVPMRPRRTSSPTTGLISVAYRSAIFLACLTRRWSRGWKVNTLITYRNGCTVRVEVVGPKDHDPQWPIRVAVLVNTELPEVVADYLKQPGAITEMNHFPALGAVSINRGRPVISSRLTIFEAEVNDQVWPRLHRPLLLLAAL